MAFRNDLLATPEALRAPSVGASAFRTEYNYITGLPADFESLGSMARAAALQAAAPDSQRLLRLPPMVERRISENRFAIRYRW